MKQWFGVAASMVLASAAGIAQGPTGIPAVDSATAARVAYRKGDVERAAKAWPVQPAYVWARVGPAVLAHDTAATLEALEAYASLSLGRDLGAMRELDFLAALPRFQAVKRRHDENRSVIANSRVVLAIADSALWPEAADYDAATRSWFIGSVRRGEVVRIDSLGRASKFWGDSTLHGALLGLRVDTDRRAVWATTSGIPQYERFVEGANPESFLVELSLDDGRLRRWWKFSAAAGGRVLGDLVVGPRGDVFVTDSRNPVLFRLRPGADTLDSMTHPLFRSLQGLAPTPDGRALYLADYSHGLLRVDLATSRVIRLSEPPHTTSLGCDGIALHRGSLVCVQNGLAPARIMRFDLDASGSAITRATILDRNWAVADEPTIGTMVGDEFVYVANSQWEKHDEAGRPLAGVARKPPVLLGVKVKP